MQLYKKNLVPLCQAPIYQSCVGRKNEPPIRVLSCLALKPDLVSYHIQYTVEYSWKKSFMIECYQNVHWWVWVPNFWINTIRRLDPRSKLNRCQKRFLEKVFWISVRVMRFSWSFFNKNKMLNCFKLQIVLVFLSLLSYLQIKKLS